jgi:hypothetical protein
MKTLLAPVLCLAAALAVLAPPLHGQDDDEERAAPKLETRVFDVSRLTRALQSLGYEDFGLGSPANMVTEVEPDDPEALVPIDTIVELV